MSQQQPSGTSSQEHGFTQQVGPSEIIAQIPSSSKEQMQSLAQQSGAQVTFYSSDTGSVLARLTGWSSSKATGQTGQDQTMLQKIQQQLGGGSVTIFHPEDYRTES